MIVDIVVVSDVAVQHRFTACLSDVAKLARRQRGEKKCSPRECGRILEHRAAQSQRGGSAVVGSTYFFLLFYTILTSTERGASAVENLGSPRY